MKFAIVAVAALCAVGVIAAEPVKTKIVCTKDMKATKEFKVLKAAYGTKDKQKDVTKQVIAAMAKKQKNIQASNSLAGDPAVGIGKSLEIVYSVNGQIKAIAVNEGGVIDFSKLK